MGRASSSKKVSRIASTGGGRVSRSARPWMWWFGMGLVVVLGFVVIGLSREDYRDEVAAGSDLVPPIRNQDHWHAAYGVFLCDEFAPPITDQRDPKGIHTHADGLIHIHPFVRSAAGDNAVLARFAEATDMTLTDEKLKVPGGKTFEEGKTKCGDEPGIVQVKVNGEVITENVADIKLLDGQRITIAFAPEGAELPDPPSVANLAEPGDLAPGEAPPAVPAPEPEAGTSGTGEAPAAGGDTTTSAPQETTTSSP